MSSKQQTGPAKGPDGKTTHSVKNREARPIYRALFLLAGILSAISLFLLPKTG